MIQVSDKTLCCGCSACANRCPKQCITMESDGEGFLYPVVDESLCIDCGLCDKVCHELHPFEEHIPTRLFAAKNMDEEVRLASSSGGIFSLLAEKIIKEGGVVFGARFDNNWQVKLDYTESISGISNFRGSKYVQASTDYAYSDCERFLKDGRQVLFTGTPCQIAGLKHFLRKDYDNLLTVDFVCHGTPSPKVWEHYLDETIDSINKHIKAIRFRDKKEKGWKQYRMAFDFEEKVNAITISVSNQENAYMRAFLSNLDLRPSCHNCKAKGGRSGSDITIGDFWGIQDFHPEIDDDKGTSLVMIHTPKGETAIDIGDFDFVESTYQNAIAHNSAIYKSVASHPNRQSFFSKLGSGSNLQKLVNNELKPSFKYRLGMLLSQCKQFCLRCFEFFAVGVKPNSYCNKK